nr:AAA family ATPase [Thalassovita aquimarina]
MKIFGQDKSQKPTEAQDAPATPETASPPPQPDMVEEPDAPEPQPEEAEPMAEVQQDPPEPATDPKPFHHKEHYFAAPPPPRTMEETGLSDTFLIGLVSKVLQQGGTMTPAEISAVIKIPKVICRQIIKEMSHLLLVEAQGLETQDIKSDIRYSLTDRGKKWAMDAMAVSQYVGPAPVTLKMFEEQVRKQSIDHEKVHRAELDKAFSHLVIPDILKAQLGPAVNSGRSMLMYGEPGNGKTSLAEAIGTSFVDIVSFPYAILVGNQLIRFYDETLHQLADMPEDADPIDPRWVACHRPVVIAGGELTLPMLDLEFEHTARYYEAPMHLKALGGIFVLDDFGRQLERPQAYLNRWIVPLEKGYDFLSLHTGKKFMVPFDQLVVFSSNFFPEDLGDEASLRRIYFKIHVPSPTREDYLQIFRDVCKNAGLEWKSDVMDGFFERKYVKENYVTSGAHPGFLVSHILAACRYLDRTPELSDELLELAWRNVAASKKQH